MTLLIEITLHLLCQRVKGLVLSAAGFSVEKLLCFCLFRKSGIIQGEKGDLRRFRNFQENQTLTLHVINDHVVVQLIWLRTCAAKH